MTRPMNSSRVRLSLLAILLALVLVLTTGGGAVARPTMHDGGGPAPPDSSTGSSEVVYDWPIGSGEVTRPFDDPAQPWLAGHRGVDLAGSEGATVRAAADGTVAFAGAVAGKPVVSIDHADGLRTTYEPVLATVGRGQSVQRGEQIGTLAAGHGTGSDLHWGARRGPDDYVDPTLLVNAAVVIRLHPLERT